MKKLFLVLLVLAGCSTKHPEQPEMPLEFTDLKGCFLLYNMKTNKLEKQYGTTCNDRMPPFSTFKVPLAVMAFDSGVLKDEKQMLKWDGKERWMKEWNRDQNAKTWMKYSVVWFSQELTPMIGEKKVQEYLNGFDYGNKDLSAGLTEAWLVTPGKEPALLINSFEQLEFMKKLWTNSLPVSKKAMKLTQEITNLDLSPKGYKLSGKTGSNFYDKEKKYQAGWFIAHVSKDLEEYIAITNISDLKPYEGKTFGGLRAKEITLKLLMKYGLWDVTPVGL